MIHFCRKRRKNYGAGGSIKESKLLKHFLVDAATQLLIPNFLSFSLGFVKFFVVVIFCFVCGRVCYSSSMGGGAGM